MKHRRKFIFLTLLFILLVAGVYGVYAWTPLAVVDDPLVRMPGTQEPGFNWQGSMMAQSARDFLFWSCFTVSAQDSIWAVGTPNATDICERCHFPKGWLEGRSDPTNASLMTGADFDGVQCDFCHRMWDPHFETTYAGTREGSDWLGYWDETNASDTPSQAAADTTYAADIDHSQSILRFDGTNFYNNNSLPPANYTEAGSGQFFVSPDAAKRASFADAEARHQMFYSRFHKSKYMCATCHDVSNPILANLGLSGLPDDGTGLITEQHSAANYFHVERTFSEFMLSAYGQQGGAPTNQDFQDQGAPDITQAAKCQDCHMRDVVGQGADLKNAVVRPAESVEHPQSGQPLHDLTGGNAWVSWVLASAVPGSPNHDPFNEAELNKGPAVLTLDLTQGEGIDPAAMLAGVDRAKQQLLLAATIKNPSYDSATGGLPRGAAHVRQHQGLRHPG
jgi:cytochrome c553